MHKLFLMTLDSLEMLLNTNRTNTGVNAVLMKNFKTQQLGSLMKLFYLRFCVSWNFNALYYKRQISFT